jgi:hypothetical protein
MSKLTLNIRPDASAVDASTGIWPFVIALVSLHLVSLHLVSLHKCDRAAASQKANT